MSKSAPPPAAAAALSTSRTLSRPPPNGGHLQEAQAPAPATQAAFFRFWSSTQPFQKALRAAHEHVSSHL